jgi:hypothetical protein
MESTGIDSLPALFKNMGKPVYTRNLREDSLRSTHRAERGRGEVSAADGAMLGEAKRSEVR